ALRMERALATNRALTPRRGAQPAAAAGGGGGGGGGQTSCFPADDERLFVNSPPGTAGQTVDVTVTTPRGTSQTGAGTKFSYVPPTTTVVNALSPNHGTANGTTQVTIFGSGLSGATQVSFGGTMVPNCNAQASAVRTLRPQSRTRWVQVGRRTLTSKSTRAPLTSLEGGGPSQCFVPSGSDTMLTVPSAAGTAGQTVHVTVTSAAGTSAATNADFFKYTQPGAPAVDAVDPNHGTAFGG